MNEVLNIIFPVLTFIAVYFWGWSNGNSAGYQNALQKLADGSLHLTINVKRENFHSEVITKIN